MDAGVDHETHRAPHLVVETAHVGIRIGIEAHLLGQQLGIEPPAFDIGRRAVLRAETRDARQLLRDRDLHVMAGQAFVIGGALEVPQRHRRHVGQVHVVDARPRAIRRARIVVLHAALLFAERLDALHDQIGLRQDAEIFRQLRLHRR